MRYFAVTFLHAALLGAGATATMDLWAAFLWRAFSVPSLDFALLGRWIGHFPRGQFAHQNIKAATPVRYERVVGWAAHYTIGIVFAALLLAVFGLGWIQHPTLLVSSATLVAPFFIMQPAMGFGVASSKMPRPFVARLRSVVTHSVYGLGLYLSARLLGFLNG